MSYIKTDSSGKFLKKSGKFCTTCCAFDCHSPALYSNCDLIKFPASHLSVLINGIPGAIASDFNGVWELYSLGGDYCYVFQSEAGSNGQYVTLTYTFEYADQGAGWEINVTHPSLNSGNVITEMWLGPGDWNSLDQCYNVGTYALENPHAEFTALFLGSLASVSDATGYMGSGFTNPILNDMFIYLGIYNDRVAYYRTGAILWFSPDYESGGPRWVLSDTIGGGTVLALQWVGATFANGDWGESGVKTGSRLPLY